MSGQVRRKQLAAIAAGGAAAGLIWRRSEPTLQRIFGHPYSDPELLTAFAAKGRPPAALDYGVQAGGGALFALAFARCGGRTIGQLLAVLAAEQAALVALFPLLDRLHPAVRNGRWPPLRGNPRAIAVSAGGHLVYGLLLGPVARRVLGSR
jgi:hypothetical protein